MTRFLLLVIAFAFFLSEGKAQKDHASSCDSVHEISAYSADSLLERSLQDYYTKGHFKKLLQKHGIKKITCAGCDAVWVELVFTVDANGKIIPVEAKQIVFCHRQKTDVFLRNFYLSLAPLTVPKRFAGRCYVYRFGRALKC